MIERNIPPEVEVESAISLVRQLAQQLLPSVLINIRREERRRKLSARGNADVRIPSTQDLVRALDLHHLPGLP
jgi:hypothetical protein